MKWCWNCGRYAQPSRVKGWCQSCLKTWRPAVKEATR